MQNPRATTSLKPGGRDVNIAKYLSQMNIGHHCRKWKSPILGVERIVLRDVFLASIFLAYVEPKLFFAIAWENSPVHPLTKAQTLCVYKILVLL
jgi:hypothetical protein